MTVRMVTAPQLARLLGGRTGPGPAYAALAAGLRMLVLDGRLALETRVPAERQLAEALGVSRTTVAAAYEQLRSAGYLRSRRGAGSWTALPADRRRDPADAPFAPVGAVGPAGQGLLDLAQATLPAPAGALHQAATAALAELPRHLPTHGYDPFGLAELREVVAERYTARGLPTGPDEILVTNGAQHAFMLALRLFAGPGDRVLVEHPTYPHALDLVRRHGGRLVPVGVDAQGWDLDLLRAAVRQSAPTLAYLIPDFHNPTGQLLLARGRQELAELARATGTPLGVDETLAELGLDEGLDGGGAPPPVAAYGRGAQILSVGSVSKTFWGGLRIGWIRAAPELVRRLVALRATLDMGSPVLEQLVSAELLRGADDVLVPRRAELRARRDRFVDALGAALPEWRVNRPAGGLSLWAELDAPVSTALVYAAEAHGVRLAAGPRFGVDGAFERFLRLPFTQPAEVLLDTVARLRAAYHAVTERPGTRTDASGTLTV
jgi:DNA-binding transcriptional MocR family regulator